MTSEIKLKDLYEGTLIVKQDATMALLNHDPNPAWVKEHPFIKGYKYLPIERIEYLLKSIFKTNYKIEVLKTGLLLNTVEVTVRVHFKDITSGEWMFHDGVGAQEIQTKKDSGHLQLDMSNINRGAITMALPIAKTIAIKDACDHFGKMFGSDLNRKDYVEYSTDLTLQAMDENHPNWYKVCEAVKSKAYAPNAIADKYTLTEESRNYLNDLYDGKI
jgi:hypothetical protein